MPAGDIEIEATLVCECGSRGRITAVYGLYDIRDIGMIRARLGEVHFNLPEGWLRVRYGAFGDHWRRFLCQDCVKRAEEER